jgi:hypothetical protein
MKVMQLQRFFVFVFFLNKNFIIKSLKPGWWAFPRAIAAGPPVRCG